VTCAPIYGSLILSKENNITSGASTVLLISLGRFLSYAVFGLITGYAGTLIGNFAEYDTVIAFSYFFVAGYLTYSALIRNRVEKGCCPAPRYAKLSGNPFIIGLLTGISICPAFLGAITKGIETGGIIGGLMLFTGFFFGTTLYLLPLSFLSYFTKKKFFRYIGIAASIAVATWFVYDGSTKLYDRLNSYIVNFTENPVMVITTDQDIELNKLKMNIAASKILDPDEIEKAVKGSQQREIVLITSSNLKNELSDKIRKMNKNVAHIKVEKSEDIEKKIEFLKFYSFKGRHSTGFLYTVP